MLRSVALSYGVGVSWWGGRWSTFVYMGTKACDEAVPVTTEHRDRNAVSFAQSDVVKVQDAAEARPPLPLPHQVSPLRHCRSFLASSPSQWGCYPNSDRTGLRRLFMLLQVTAGLGKPRSSWAPPHRGHTPGKWALNIKRGAQGEIESTSKIGVLQRRLFHDQVPGHACMCGCGTLVALV